MDERDDRSETNRREFLRRLGLGAAAVSAPGVLAGCNLFNPYHHPH